MIIVCNDTRMAQLMEKYIAEKGYVTPALANRVGDQRTVRIDSRLLDAAELREESETASDAAERLRQVVATVGREGQPGAAVRCLISVAMLSEGWDARNVTQILGLRAFQSQLLCEQVIGRGLRRSDYTDLSVPEFVDVYGVPFQLLPFARGGGGTPIEPPQTTFVHTVPSRADLRLEFPRVVQVVHQVGERLSLDVESIQPIRVSAESDPTMTWVGFDVGTRRVGLGNVLQDRTAAYERFRLQSLVFAVAAEVIRPYERPWLFPQWLSWLRR
jgi:type III restriction enzyme